MPKVTSRSFTLIELLLVVSIIGILSGVLTTVINPETQRMKARDVVTKAMLEKMVLAVQDFYSAHGEYPQCENFLRVVSTNVDDYLDAGDLGCDTSDPTPDDNVTFAINGVDLPESCNNSLFYGQGTNLCHFHYNGGWQEGTEGMSPHFYVKTWQNEDEYFCWNPPYTGGEIQVNCDRTCGQISTNHGSQICN